MKSGEKIDWIDKYFRMRWVCPEWSKCCFKWDFNLDFIEFLGKKTTEDSTVFPTIKMNVFFVSIKIFKTVKSETFGIRYSHSIFKISLVMSLDTFEEEEKLHSKHRAWNWTVFWEKKRKTFSCSFSIERNR